MSAARRPQAPSLDIMAATAAAGLTPSAADPAASAGPAGRTAPPADPSAAPPSRSSSSTNSPLAHDNEESDFFLVANDSESSLGVSNLQDMQVADDAAADGAADRTAAGARRCQPPVARLPNEILIAVFAKLGAPADLLHCMLACKRWARNAVDLLWHRPACTVWPRHESICKTLGVEHPAFAYKDFIKRLNLASIADKVNDGSVLPLAVCNRIERLTLTNCKRLTDTGLVPLVENSHHLLALDIAGDDQITEATILAIAQHCRRLQGLNVTGCTRIANEGLIQLAASCKYIKRIKLNDCHQLTDDAVLAFADHCPSILEIDLHQCRLVTNEPVTRLLARGQALRELRLTNCDLVDDNAFLALPDARVYEHLRILDLTSCVRLTDRAVERIVAVAPRLRNLVLAKCRNITDAAVHAIARLGKNLHYVHLGHCNQITDDAVKRLVHACNRIRYIDLGCCVHLTDESVVRLATLPKLKRIGLVKCSNITDESVYALARANQRQRQRRDPDGHVLDNHPYSHSSLERVHLSYCTNLSIRSIIRLLNTCHRLTHLSLTGVPAFLREDLSRFCRSPPTEFTMHQREVFCVFSGEGVSDLREHLNTQPGYASYRDRPPGPAVVPNLHRTLPGFHDGLGVPGALEGAAGVGAGLPPAVANGHLLNFDDADPDVPDDDDASEMVVDEQPPPPPPPPQPLDAHPHPPPVPPPGPFPGQAYSAAAAAYTGLPMPIPIPAPSTLLPTAPPFMPGAFVQLVRFPDHLRPSPGESAGQGPSQDQQQQHPYPHPQPHAHAPPFYPNPHSTAVHDAGEDMSVGNLSGVSSFHEPAAAAYGPYQNHGHAAPPHASASPAVVGAPPVAGSASTASTAAMTSAAMLASTAPARAAPASQLDAHALSELSLDGAADRAFYGAAYGASRAPMAAPGVGSSSSNSAAGPSSRAGGGTADAETASTASSYN